MGLFGKKTARNTAETKEAVVTQKKVQPQAKHPYDVTAAIIRPRITEKAALLLERNVYSFEVRKGATKHEIRDAIKELYKVTPVSVRIVSQNPRHYKSLMRGRSMMDSGLRKAYVYLKKGDSINLA